MTITKNIIVPGKHEKPILTDVFYSNYNTSKPLIIFCHGYKGFKDWGAWDLMAKAFADAGFFEGGPESCLHISQGSGFRRIALRDAAASSGRKEPDRIAMRFPVHSEEVQGALGQGYIAVFAAFAKTYMHEHAGAVDIGDLQMRAFFDT